MLSQLSIKNFGLIDSVALEFDGQFNILTGETGAGKSILIDALRIVLGGRMAPSFFRDNGDECTLEAVFDLSGDLLKNEVLLEFLGEEDSQLIIRRSCVPPTRTKIKINGQSVTVSQLKAVGNVLIDFHGAHDHQMLLSSNSHKGMLDRLIDFGKTQEDYLQSYHEYKATEKKLNNLRGLSSSRDRDVDLLAHQVKELEQLPLEKSVYEELIAERSRIDNAEKLHASTNQLIEIFEGDPNTISELIRKSFSSMKDLNQIDEQTNPHMDMLIQLQDLSEQLASDIRHYSQNLSFDPTHAQDVSSRCDLYDDIKRKFGPTLSEAQTFFEEAKEKLELLNNMEHNDEELSNELEAHKKTLKQKAQKITKLRKKQALLLKDTIEKELSELGIVNVQFEARMEPTDFGADGLDEITFYISPNAGEALKPLAEIVSSGEAARVMLALKKALIKVDPIPVLIFDEIDAQIGGRLGTITGKKLREISRNRQVILITHLPQIASFADAHFKVIKSVKNNRTLTQVLPLNKKERIEELAQMMSGEKTSKISVKHAEDLLANAGG